MRTFLFVLLLGLGTSCNSAWAQPSRVWQREFDKVRNMGLYVADVKELRPNLKVGVGFTYRYLGSGLPNLNHFVFWRFNATGDTLGSRRYLVPATYGSYTKLLPSKGSDLLALGIQDTVGVRANLVNACFFVRTDSLGNWRGRPRYVPNCLAVGETAAIPLPNNSVLWAHTVITQVRVSGALLDLAGVQAVRLDSAQRIAWRQQYPGATPGYNGVKAAAITSLLDGSYVVIGIKGRAFQPPYNAPPFVVTSGWQQRIRANGDTINLPEYFGRIDERYEPREVLPTADGGYVVAGNVYPENYVPAFNCCSPPRGWVGKFDPQGRLQWQQRLGGRNPIDSSARIARAVPLANGRYLLVGGRTSADFRQPYTDYLATYAPTANGVAPVWEYDLPYVNNDYPLGPSTALAPDGSLTFAGTRTAYDTVTRVTTYPGLLTRYANLGTPYVPDYCAIPPYANAAYQFNATGDTLRFYELSLGGPRYALVERWRWHLGDGTFYEGRIPPPHRYARPLPVGTPVTLTVTNNLGCSTTVTLYPWGLPTATQQALALVAATSLFPNPAATTATLTLGTLPAGPPATAQVLDALGRTVLPQQTLTLRAGTATAVFDVASLSAGVYAVRVVVGSTAFVKRLVVQR